MKVTVFEGDRKPERPYPKLMQEKGGGAIVLFDRPGRGITLTKSTTFERPMYIQEDPSHFEDFEGSVLLSND